MLILRQVIFENIKSISVAKNKNKPQNRELGALGVGRTVDYEDAALLPTACGPVQYGDTGTDCLQGNPGSGCREEGKGGGYVHGAVREEKNLLWA